MNQLDFRRAARKPWRKLNVKLPASLTAEPIVIEWNEARAPTPAGHWGPPGGRRGGAERKNELWTVNSQTQQLWLHDNDCSTAPGNGYG